MYHARATFTAANPNGHRLHNKPKPRIGGCAFRLAQKPGTGALPSARHRAQHMGQLHIHFLREGLISLVAIGGQSLDNIARCWRFGIVKRVWIQPRHMGRISVDKPKIEGGRCRFTVTFAELRKFRIIHANVQNRARPAPIWATRGWPH